MNAHPGPRAIDGQTVLVTGGAGFVGSHLIRRLLQQHPDVRVVSVDNYFTGTVERQVDDPRVTYLNASTVELSKVWASEGLPRPEFVFHFGEYSRVVRSLEEPDLTWEYNLRGTKEVVDFTRRHGAKIVYAGSSSKFGNDGQDERLNPYAWTKAKNVEYLANYSQWYGLDYVVAYFYNVYGPGHIRTGKYATVIGIFEDHFERGLPLPVVSPGTQTRDFTHVDDIISGILLCAEFGEGDGYLLGTGTEWPILEVAEMLGGPIEFTPALPGERTRGRADISKAVQLGYTVTRTLPDYIAEFKRGLADGRAR
ncbi:NAD-dependent epimerase/dehydratase family protein [Dactylosporangium darangshiense]|uniref:SDR family oxidoreductase n=1 Tax=Dactylosporangium darangshiense TaxID=579108 RepID=A0ABP8DTB4_9ACTN